MSEREQPPSWQADPFNRHEQRWWDGSRWSEKVRSGSTTGIDPPGIVASPENPLRNERVEPITDATTGVAIRSNNLPRALLVGVLLVAVLVAVVLIGIATSR